MKSLVFDTETTGLIENVSVRLERQPEVIEFYGAVISDDGTVERELDTLIRPMTNSISPEIKKITGISPEMVENEKPFAYYASEIKELIESVDEVIAHNLTFDMDMINIEFQRLNNQVVKWPLLWTCTIEQSIHYQGKRLNLGALHEHLFGEKFVGAHRAKIDVEALIRCVVEMRRRRDL